MSADVPPEEARTSIDAVKRPWTCAEEAALSDLAAFGARMIGHILGRSTQSVKDKASRLGVSVKKKSNIDATVLRPEVLEHIKHRRAGLLCPACATRVVVTREGLCGACHKEALTDSHNATYRELVAHRDYDASKQQVKRKRAELGVQAPKKRQGRR